MHAMNEHALLMKQVEFGNRESKMDHAHGQSIIEKLDLNSSRSSQNS